ncbi:MAG: trigger factor [Clostridia bacterium]|nr:trigger factor [Clostridia bacterium]
MSLKETKKLDVNRHQLEILIDGETFRNAIKEAYRKNGKNIAVPGFRKGKAPLSYVETYYGKEVFYEDALNLLYGDAVEAAITESGLNVINDKMDFELVSISKEDGVDFKVSVTTYPEIELGEYKGLKAERIAVKVEADEIDAEINNMVQRNARMVSVEDRAAAKGDTVVIDYEGFVDGVAFDGGKAEGQNLELGSGAFIPGFEEQIEGKNIDDEFEINVTFPEEYGAKELAGKEAVFKIKLHEIKVRELPAVDDEFVKDVSEFDTLDELKADIEKKINDRKTKAADEEVENALVSQIVEGIKGEIPEAMYENRLDQQVEDFAYRMQMQGMNLETYLKYTNSTIEDFRKSFRPQAEMQVKFRLALEKVVELEGIKAEEKDIEEQYQKMAENYGMELDKVKAAVPASELQKDIAVGKAIDFIKENAVITEVVEKTEKAEKPAAKKTTTKKSTTAKKDGEEKPAAKKTTAAKSTTAKKTTAKKETAEKKTEDAE